MKFIAFFLCLCIVLAFASIASAQCADYAGCVGQVAEGSARLKEYQRATAEVIATERAAIRAATSEARSILATESVLSATATELSRPTQTPRPTATQTATPTQLPTATPLPSATTSPSVTPYPTQTATPAQIVEQVDTPAQGNGEWSVFRWVATLVGLPICAIMFFWAIARFRKVI